MRQGHTNLDNFWEYGKEDQDWSKDEDSESRIKGKRSSRLWKGGPVFGEGVCDVAGQGGWSSR